MNEVDISSKNEQEILGLVKNYVSQGYQVWIQKRCTDKYLMQSEYDVFTCKSYKIAGVLEMDDSTSLKRKPTADVLDIPQQKVFRNQQSVEYSTDSIKETFMLRSLGPTALQIPSNKSLMTSSRKNQPDLMSLLSPNMQSREGFNLEHYFNQLQQGLQYDEEGNIGLAINALNELIESIERALQASFLLKILNIIYVEAMLSLGMIYARVGQYSESKLQFLISIILSSTLEKCLRLFVIKDQLLLAKVYLKLGLICLQLLVFKKSVDYFKLAINLFEIYELRIEVAQTVAYLGLVHAQLGYHEIALNLVYGALKELKLQLTKDAFIMGVVYHILGEVFYLNEEYQEAVQFFDIAYDIKVLHPQQVFSQILTLNAMGNACQNCGEYNKALEVYHSALHLINEKDTLTEAQLLNNLSVCLIAIGKKTQGKLDKAIGIYQIYYDGNHPSIKRTYRNMRLAK